MRFLWSIWKFSSQNNLFVPEYFLKTINYHPYIAFIDYCTSFQPSRTENVHKSHQMIEHTSKREVYTTSFIHTCTAALRFHAIVQDRATYTDTHNTRQLCPVRAQQRGKKRKDPYQSHPFIHLTHRRVKDTPHQDCIC
jgi:hypothetical protein